MSEIPVFVEGRRVGILAMTRYGDVDFVYDAGVPDRLSVSLTMPVSGDPENYTGFNGLPPPFEVALPEGWLHENLVRRFGKYLDLSSDFALLGVVGRGLVGRVTFGGPPAEQSLLERLVSAAVSGANARALAAIVDSMEPSDFGLSGVMPKLPVACTAEGRPATIAAARQILKFEAGEYPGIAIAEYLALECARQFGIPTATAHLGQSGDTLLVDRFDRDAEENPLGFEDFCCLSGLRRSGKYNGSMEQAFSVIDSYVDEDHVDEDKLVLLKTLLLNDVLRNGDAHLKNYGLIYTDPAHARLAPAYDILDTTLYQPEDRPAMALESGSAEKTWLTEESCHRLGELCGLPVNVLALREECVTSVQATLAQMRKVIDAGLVDVTARPMAHRITERMLAHATIPLEPSGEELLAPGCF
ncbi:MAG: type II toxin-antitoxin system HipA family toxin [Thiomonas sp.]